jgi:hypothetical protein
MLFVTGGDEYRHGNYSALEDLVGSHRLSEADHLKLHLVLMAYYGHSDQQQKLREHFSRVRHVRQVSACARTIYEKYEK